MDAALAQDCGRTLKRLSRILNLLAEAPFLYTAACALAYATVLFALAPVFSIIGMRRDYGYMLLAGWFMMAAYVALMIMHMDYRRRRDSE